METSISSSSRAPLSTFTNFPSLPTELRLKVWIHALPGPRIVHLKQKRLKELEGPWWARVRSDVWSCEEDDRNYQLECVNKGENISENRLEVEPRDEESKEQEDTVGSSSNELGPDPDQEFGDGVHRPKSLWGFRTESIMPDMLLACHESRGVALEQYQCMFGSLGTTPQIYFDPLRDTLLIDHDTFFGEYEELPALIAEYLLPGDLATIRELAIEGTFRTQDGIFVLVDEDFFETSLLFSHLRTITNVCYHRHIPRGPQNEIRQKHGDFKQLWWCRDGKNIYVGPKILQDRIPQCPRRFHEREWNIFWEAREKNISRPEQRRPRCAMVHLISAAAEKLLLQDAKTPE